MSRRSRRSNRIANDELSSDEENSQSPAAETSSDSTSSGEEEQQRDLTNDEMEKLIQLQDLTGIDDLQICRALLESKQWDLEATAREHLNLPSNEPSTSSQRPSAPIPEAPNARQVLRPQQPRQNRDNPIVARGSNSVFTWAAYLITLPFRMTYRTVFGVFDFVLSIFGLHQDTVRSQRRLLGNNTRPEEDVATFISEFRANYGADHVPFHTGSYTKALDEAKRDLRFLLVYLHSPSHQNSQKFCQTTLASPHFRDFILNMNVIVWGCSVETPEGYRVSQALRESGYPFLALIVLRRNKMMVVGRVEESMEVEPLCERLQVVIRDNEAYIVAANAERAERSMNAEIRQEQDAAFQETLRQDQERERLKREAEEEQRRIEEAQRKAEEDEKARKEEIRRQKIELVNEVPEEPGSNDPDSVRILIKLPEGQRLERRFLKYHSLKYLYYYVFCHPDSPDEFDITTNFPRKVLDCKPVSNQPDPPTFEEAGLGQSTMLFVNDLDA